ncbi:sodium:proton antiporter [Planctomonas sp. JC2975]|nr:sodium:proton antiporter [Planctomonas sp. JC2975]
MPDDGRTETVVQRSDRNWSDILQELRVTQTGTQIITGFLLALAFQPRFTTLDAFSSTIYLVLVCLAATATALNLTPVSLHRWLFRRHVKRELVVIGNVLLRITLATVGLLVIGVVLFIFDVVLSRAAGLVAGGITAAVVVALWILLPLAARRARG